MKINKAKISLILPLLIILSLIELSAQIINWDSLNLSNTVLVEGKINGFNMGESSYARINHQSDFISVPTECTQCATPNLFCLDAFSNVNGVAFTSMETKSAVINQSSRLKPSILRFPGGTHSGWYHLYAYDSLGFYNAEAPVIAKGYGMSLIETARLDNPFKLCRLDSRLTISENYIDGFINYINNTQNAIGDSKNIEVAYVANLLTHFNFPSELLICVGCSRQEAIEPMQNFDCNTEFAYAYEGNEALFDDNPDVYRFELYYKETQDAINRIVTSLNLESTDVVNVEMGNEYYNASGYPVGTYGMETADYARLVEIYSQRLKCFFDGIVNIKIGVVTKPDTPWHMDLINLLDDDLDNNGTTLNDEVDAVIFHHYYAQDYCLSDSIIEDRFNCAKDVFRNHIEIDLESNLNNLQTNFPDQKIWITEWNMVRGNGEQGFNNSFINTILHASFVQEYALQLLAYNEINDNAISVATHHRLGDHNVWSVIQTQEGDSTAAFYRSGAYAMEYISKLYDYDNMYFIGNILSDGTIPFDTKEAKATAFMQIENETDTINDRLLVYFSNKTDGFITTTIPDTINKNTNDPRVVGMTKLSYLRGNHLFTYGPSNQTAGKNRYRESGSVIYNNDDLNSLGYGNINDQFINVSDSLLEQGGPIVFPKYSVGVLEIELLPIIINTNELENNNLEVKIYPNPSSSFININVSVKQAQSLKINLNTSSGVNVLRLQEDVNSTEDTFKLDVSNLSNGVYFVSIQGDEKIAVKKIVVINSQ